MSINNPNVMWLELELPGDEEHGFLLRDGEVWLRGGRFGERVPVTCSLADLKVLAPIDGMVTGLLVLVDALNEEFNVIFTVYDWNPLGGIIRWPGGPPMEPAVAAHVLRTRLTAGGSNVRSLPQAEASA